MKVSFTGSRLGITEGQRSSLRELLVDLAPAAVSHGCCMGADIAFHHLVREIFGKNVKIAGFPSTLSKTRWAGELDLDFTALPKPPLERNRDIVLFGRDLLIACPSTVQEKLRSGTWACMRFARKKNVSVSVVQILPSGERISYI